MSASRKNSLRGKILCKNCQKICLELAKCKVKNERSIQCDNCKEWYHKGCINATDTEWDFLESSNASILYKCETCLNENAKKAEETKELNEKIEVLHGKFDNLTKLITSNNENLISQMQAAMLPIVSEMIDSKIQKHAEDTTQKLEDRIKNLETEKKDTQDMKSAQEDTLQKFEQRLQILESEKQKDKETENQATNKEDQLCIENKIKLQLTESIDEMKEIEERKNNIIIFNVKESPADSEDVSLEADLSNIKEILTFSNPELTNTQIQDLKAANISRMGEFKADATRPRPIKVTLQSTKIKYQILKNSKKLKDCTSHPKIGYKMDLTKKQQLAEKNLRLQLEERKKTEDCMIFKNKIILRADLAKHRAEFNAKKSETKTGKPSETVPNQNA